MNKEEIKKILPHREPMLLVDEVELIDGKAFGKCHIRGDEYFLPGPFSGQPHRAGRDSVRNAGAERLRAARRRCIGGHDSGVYEPR